LGYCALLLSVNNSSAAVAHLCKLTNASTIIWGGRYKERVLEAREILLREGEGIELRMLEEMRFPLFDTSATTPVKEFKARLEPAMERDRPAVILHSSGSVCSIFISFQIPS
jgi:hypothetical protein